MVHLVHQVRLEPDTVSLQVIFRIGMDIHPLQGKHGPLLREPVIDGEARLPEGCRRGQQHGKKKGNAESDLRHGNKPYMDSEVFCMKACAAKAANFMPLNRLSTNQIESMMSFRRPPAVWRVPAPAPWMSIGEG